MPTASTITLRALEPEDIDFVLALDNDMSLWNLGAQRAPISRSVLETYILTYDADPLRAGELRLVVDKNEKRCAIIDLFDIDPYNACAQIGVAVEKAYRQRGVGKEAVELTLRYCREVLGLKTIAATTSEANGSAMAFFKACGFEDCGRMPNRVRNSDGSRSALVIYQIIINP